MSWPADVLKDLPNRDRARPIDEVDAADLAPERFRAEYVARCRPCVIRGAVRHWPAMERWRDVEYLKAKLGSVKIPQVRTSPEMEMRWRERWGGPFAERAREERATKGEKVVPASTFLDRAAAMEFVFCYAAGLGEGQPLASLAGDLGSFAFDYGFRRARLYEARRAFFFGRSFTDWHTHQYDETLMCQVGAPKRVAMLAPTEESWTAILQIARARVQLGGPCDDFDGFQRLAPSVVDVHPGDATYIPPYWWHAVETPSENETFGATIAACWRSEPHVVDDPRFYETRQRFRDGSAAQRFRIAMRAATSWLPAYVRGRALPAVPTG